jgi:hypothetical protein
MLTSFFATSNNANGSSGSGKLTDPCSILTDTTLKFMCDICGAQMPNILSLKSHIADHKQSDTKLINTKTLTTSLSNTKLSSIIASTKNVSTSEAANSNKKNPFVINIPQTMKVFNVKDILTKLKSQNTNCSTTTTTSNNAPVSNQAKITDIKTDENFSNYEMPLKCASLQMPNEISNQVTNTSIIQLDDLDKLAHMNANNNGGTFNYVSNSEQTPYHYSEYENVYICNMCYSTYDSLRSIKAHLWKHSGHHKFSYPIHDYNNRSKCCLI